MEKLDFIGIFVIALMGSFGHCIGMCGGIVLAYCGRLNLNFREHKMRLVGYHLLYNLGRISTYIVLGVVVGFLGSMFAVNEFLRCWLFVLAGVAMILAGLSLFGKLKFLTYLEHSLVSGKWYQRKFQSLLELKNPLSLYLLGILNGLLPCGFVYAFLFGAAGFADPLIGGAIMAVFGLGTIPLLLVMALLTDTLLSWQWLRKIMMNLTALIIIIFGILMVQKGVKFIQNPHMAHKMHMQIDLTEENH